MRDFYGRRLEENAEVERVLLSRLELPMTGIVREVTREQVVVEFVKNQPVAFKACGFFGRYCPDLKVIHGGYMKVPVER